MPEPLSQKDLDFVRADLALKTKTLGRDLDPVKDDWWMYVASRMLQNVDDLTYQIESGDWDSRDY